MWKKEDTAQDETRGAPSPAVRAPEPPRSPSSSPATIGSSITIRGEVTGDEDLLIEGRVDGSVDLKKHTVTVGAEGQVKAGISGRVVTVEGRVDGDLNAEEMVVLRSSAQVQGDITAPRVVLEDGASFRGGVDMGEHAGTSSSSGTRATGATAPREKSESVSADPKSDAKSDPASSGSRAGGSKTAAGAS